MTQSCFPVCVRGGFWLVALLHACGPDANRPTEPGATRLLPATPAAATPPQITLLCPGGLLCEAAALWAGWRIPAGCEPVVAAGQVQTCVLAGAEAARVREFFRSRYPHLQENAESMWIEGHLAATPSPSVGPPRPVAPALRLRFTATDVELTALPGD